MTDKPDEIYPGSKQWPHDRTRLVPSALVSELRNVESSMPNLHSSVRSVVVSSLRLEDYMRNGLLRRMRNAQGNVLHSHLIGDLLRFTFQR